MRATPFFIEPTRRSGVASTAGKESRRFPGNACARRECRRRRAKFLRGCLTALGIFGWAVAGQADDPTPRSFPEDRYEKMAAHSPFSPPTAPVAAQPAATPPPAPSWSDKLSVTMIMEDHGVYFATVVDPESPQHLYLRSDAEDKASHMKVGSVQWDPSNRDVPPTVTIQKGEEFAQVRYETTGNGAGGGTPTGGARPSVPNIPGINNFRNPVAPPLPGGSFQGNVNQPNAPVNPVLRRAPIRAAPQPPAATGGRPVVLPGVNTPTVLPRPAPPIKTDDDDDDDD